MAVQQITELATTHMTLGAHNKFNIDVNNAIIQATAAALRVENYATLYAQKIEEESRIVNRQTAMASTVDVSAADRQRDSAVGVIMNLTNAHTTSIIAEKADAAKKLRQLLAPYKGIGNHAYQKETAEINGMVAVLTTGDGATYAATLGMDDEVDALMQANAAFEEAYTRNQEEAATLAALQSVDTKELFHKLVSVDKYIPEAIGTDSQWHSVLACEGDVTDPVDLALIELFGIKKIDVTSLIDSCVSLRKSNTRRTKYDIVSNEPFDDKDSFVIDCARKALIPSVIIPSVTFNDGNACFTHVTPGDADGGSDDASVTSLIDAIDGCDYTIDAIARASAMVCSTQFYKGDMRDALSIEGATLASVDAPDTCAVYVPYPSYRTNIAVTLGMFLVMRKLGYVDPQITKVAFIYSSDFNKQMFRKATANVPVLDVSVKSGLVGEFIDASNVAPAPCGLYFNKQPRTGHVVYVCDAKGETIPLSDEAMRKLANTVLSESVSGSYGVGYTGASTICKMLEKFFGQRMFAPEMSDDSLRCRCDDLQYGDSFVKINTSACSMPDLKSDVKAFMLGMSNSGSLEVLRKLTDESGRNTADAYCADAMRTFVRECVEHLYDEHLAKYGWRENGLDDDGAGDESEVLYSAD